MIGVYIHIPFCRTICPYCDFVKRPLKGAVPSAFIAALAREIESCPHPRSVDSVFFGGGTPSLLAFDDLREIMNAVRRTFHVTPSAEITLEANPDDVTDDLVRMWGDAGINRVSLGVQSFNDEALRYLGRRHDADVARAACATVARHFPNWNLDLIFGVPPVDAWRSTLSEAAAAGPTHVSAYGLTYEPDTPFGKRKAEAIDDDTYLAQYDAAVELLADFARYEVSNFARPGCESVHNLHYWRNDEYAGFGPGAYSFLDTVRARNHPNPVEYVKAPGEKSESLRLSDEEIRIETVIQHLRLAQGILRSEYCARFERSIDEDFGAVLGELRQRDLIVDDGERLRPTPLGFVLNNEIGLALVS